MHPHHFYLSYTVITIRADAANSSTVVCFYLQMLHTNYKANVYELETALGIQQPLQKEPDEKYKDTFILEHCSFNDLVLGHSILFDKRNR